MSRAELIVKLKYMLKFGYLFFKQVQICAYV